jgi:hypothetical protein
MSKVVKVLALFIYGQCMQHLDYLLDDAMTIALHQGTFLFICLWILL